jgi:hypothetical protein
MSSDEMHNFFSQASSRDYKEEYIRQSAALRIDASERTSH